MGCLVLFLNRNFFILCVRNECVLGLSGLR